MICPSVDDMLANLVSLAVADTITLVASVPQEILSYHILGHRWVWGPVGCTLMIYLQYLGIDASGNLFGNFQYFYCNCYILVIVLHLKILFDKLGTVLVGLIW